MRAGRGLPGPAIEFHAGAEIEARLHGSLRLLLCAQGQLRRWTRYHLKRSIPVMPSGRRDAKITSSGSICSFSLQASRPSAESCSDMKGSRSPHLYILPFRLKLALLLSPSSSAAPMPLTWNTPPAHSPNKSGSQASSSRPLPFLLICFPFCRFSAVYMS